MIFTGQRLIFNNAEDKGTNDRRAECTFRTDTPATINIYVYNVSSPMTTCSLHTYLRVAVQLQPRGLYVGFVCRWRVIDLYGK